MNITELLITGYDGAGTLFAVALTPDGAKVIRPGTAEEGDTIVGEAYQRATDAFTAIRDLMTDIVSPREGDTAMRRPDYESPRK